MVHRKGKALGASSTSPDGAFAAEINSMVARWREENNLPSDQAPDLPMRRCPKDDR